MKIPGRSWTDPARLAAWLESIGRPARRWIPLAGDVSPRRYFRVELEAGGTAILAAYPPEAREDCRRFLSTTELLEGGGVPVPAVLASDESSGLTLLEDAGERTLYELEGISRATTLAYFGRAVEIAAAIERLPPDRVAALQAPLGAAALERELEQTWRLFLEPRGATGGDGRSERLWEALERLCRRLGDEKPRPCHRDFMVRNLVPHGPAPGLRVLDHQDLRPGPPFYDLASLFNDSLFLAEDEEETLLAPRLISGEDRRRYHRAAAQRSLKAVGTYAAFAARGFDRHLPLIAPTLRRARKHLSLSPETASAARELGAAWRALEGGDDLLD